MEHLTPPSEPTTFSLRGRPGAITLDAEGLHHPTGTRRGGLVFSAYRDLTHLATSSRAIWLGTRRSVYVIARRTFVDPHGPENLVRALLAQISRQPDGSAQLARMAQIEETARHDTPLRATWGLAIACAAVYVAQLIGGQSVQVIGYFTGQLTAEGDWWRVVTGNLLHANAVHLILNLLGLIAIGSLVERSLGTAATVCVMACAGLGAMAGSGLWSAQPVVGVSGIVFGLLARARVARAALCRAAPRVVARAAPRAAGHDRPELADLVPSLHLRLRPRGRFRGGWSRRGGARVAPAR